MTDDIPNKDKIPPQPESIGSRFEKLSAALVSIVKVVGLAALIVFGIKEYEFVKDWLRNLTHAEAFGIKID